MQVNQSNIMKAVLGNKAEWIYFLKSPVFFFLQHNILML